jgi:queuine tRNA-ribosyltransferase
MGSNSEVTELSGHLPDRFRLEVLHQDAGSAARRSVLHTARGDIDLPVFMPVATQGTIKGLTADMVRATGTRMLLGNTYHLALRPGEDIVRRIGGLHAFMDWDGAILTDSGGFQIFSLGQQTRVTEQQAEFRSHIDGRRWELSPERAVEIQEALGSDVAMVLDHVVALPSPPHLVEEACDRSIRWAVRCREAKRSSQQAQFAIVQGGLEPELRRRCAAELVQIGFEGYAIGGLSVGETPAEMYRILDVTCPVLPQSQPRYLMGVGRPQDILSGILRGVDMFDCVMPTRNGRNGLAFTDQGPVRLRNLQHRDDPRPLDPDTPSAASGLSRAYLRHLFQAGEMLGPILLTSHNLCYYQRIMREARLAIEQDQFVAYYESKMRGWGEIPALPDRSAV